MQILIEPVYSTRQTGALQAIADRMAREAKGSHTSFQTMARVRVGDSGGEYISHFLR